MGQRGVSSEGLGRSPRGPLVFAIVGTIGVLLVLGLAATMSRPGATTIVRVGPPATRPLPPKIASSATETTAPEVRVIGHSVRGRSITVSSFGHGPLRLLIVGGIHGNEYGTSVAGQLVRYLAAHPALVPAQATVDVVTCANPDGFASGTRTNAAGVDINRNFSVGWRASGARPGESAGNGPGSEPETRALMGLLAGHHYSRVVALHSAGGLIDFDGPGGRALARDIAVAARSRVVHLASLHPYSGSMGRYVPAKYGIPIITWELGNKDLSLRVLAGLHAAMQ